MDDVAGEEMRVGGPGPQVKGSVGSESLDAWRWGPLVVSYHQSHPAVQLGPRIPKYFNVDLHASMWPVPCAFWV